MFVDVLGIVVRLIDSAEKDREKLVHIGDVARASSAGFWKFAMFLVFAKLRKVAPLDAYHSRRLERCGDCGPRLQIAVNQTPKAYRAN
jgi:hypothetical protein